MKTRETRFPLLLEFTLVLGITYGLIVVPALVRALASRALAPMVVSDARMAYLAIFELFTGALALGVLRLNGWRRSDLGLTCTLGDGGMGVLLFLAVMAWHYLSFMAIRSLLPGSAVLRGLGMGGSLSLPVVVLVCVVNPLFEEGILLGYVMKVLRPQGFAVACGISLLLRLATHLYQGPFAVVAILPVGLIFAAFYWRTTRLWPVVFAHMLLDFLPMLKVLR